MYGVPLTNTSGATCSSVTSKLKKVSTSLYVNKYTSIAFSQLQSLLANFPVVSVIAFNSDIPGYLGASVPFNCTYLNITNDYQLTYSIHIIGYDSSNNIIMETAGLSSFGGGAYNATTATGQGYGKMSSTNSYCGALKKVYQFSTTSNTTTNNTFSYYVYERWLVAGGVMASALLLTL